MSASNLATVIGPNLLYKKSEFEYKYSNEVIESMILDFDVLFLVILYFLNLRINLSAKI